MAESRWRHAELRRRCTKAQVIGNSHERVQIGKVTAIHS
jgi:hypothetical protein